MSWSIEEHIGDCRPFPAQVVVYRGETDERLAYVSGEVADRLKAENAKLRELIRHMRCCFNREYTEYGVDFIATRCEGCKYDNASGRCDFDNRMAELGVEVDA